MEQAQLGRWTKLAGYFYDFATVVICCLDIVTDVLVVCAYYQAGKLKFFRTGLAFLIAVHLVYLYLFMSTFGNRWLKRDVPCRKQVLFVLCVVPFVQLVPLLMWLDTYHIRFITRLQVYFNLGSEAGVEQQGDQHWDWVKMKLEQHKGCWVESLIEALPMTALQLRGILHYQEVGLLSMVSLVLSMTSVASKGLIMSYSLNWHVIIFNSLCFAADIFGTCSALCWFFYNPNQTGSTSLRVLDKLWLVQLSSVAGSIALFLALFIFAIFCLIMAFMLFMLCQSSLDILIGICNVLSCRRRNVLSRCCEKLSGLLQKLPTYLGACVGYLILGIAYLILGIAGITITLCFCSFLLIIFLMAVQTFKFSLVNTVFTVEEKNGYQNKKAHQMWFSWLMNASTKLDSRIRFAVSMKVIKEKNRLLRAKNRSFGRCICRKHISCSRIECCSMNELLPPRVLDNYPIFKLPKMMVDDIFDDNTARQNKYLCIVRWWMMFCFGLPIFVLTPFLALSMIYNILYPVLSIIVNQGTGSSVEVVLTSMYIAQLCLILLFAPKTIQYRQLMKKVFLSNAYFKWTDQTADWVINTLKRRYYGYLTEEVKAQLVLNFFRPNIGGIILEMLGEEKYLLVDPSHEEEQYLHFPLDVDRYRDDKSIYDFWNDQDRPSFDYRCYQVEEEAKLPKDEVAPCLEMKEERAAEIVSSAKQKMFEVGMVGLVREVSQSIGSASIVSMARENSGRTSYVP